MARGEIVIIAGTSGYGGKPRPAVIVQSDEVIELDSVTVCMFTSGQMAARILRPLIQPSAENGLTAESHLMIDKLMTIRRDKVGPRVGRLNVNDMDRLDRALAFFLGLAK